MLDEWRYPGIQDEFERIQARQRVLGTLLIAALLMLFFNTWRGASRVSC